MSDLLVHLLPEMVGLAVTPAAVVATLLLLGSPHPFRNVAAFGGVFLVVYGALAAVVVAIGRAADPSTDDPSTPRGWISLAVGLLFLGIGVAMWLRGSRAPAPDGPAPAPAWVAKLTDPSVRLVLTAGLVLAVLNPNVAILLSGLGIILTAEVSGAEQVVGAALLLAASMVDFVVPALAFVLAGARGRATLEAVTRWLVAHNHVIGVVVLVFFGLLFTGRALGWLLS